jgi:hypothetical protein
MCFVFTNTKRRRGEEIILLLADVLSNIYHMARMHAYVHTFTNTLIVCMSLMNAARGKYDNYRRSISVVTPPEKIIATAADAVRYHFPLSLAGAQLSIIVSFCTHKSHFERARNV